MSKSNDKNNGIYLQFHQPMISELGYKLKRFRENQIYDSEEIAGMINLNLKRMERMEEGKIINFNYLSRLARFYRKNLKIVLEDK